MTTLAEDVFAKLSTTAAITAVYGTSPTRAFPLRIPESVSTYPALAIQNVGGTPEHTHDGLVDKRARLVQLMTYDTDYNRCQAAAATLVAALVGRSTWGGNDTTCLLAGDVAEDVDPEPRGLFRARVDLAVMSAAT